MQSCNGSLEKTSGRINAILWLNHSDSVSGATFFDDGSVIYWSEELMVGQSPTGERVRMDLQSMKDFGYDYAIKCFTDGPSETVEIRVMTPDEEEKFQEIDLYMREWAC